MAFGLETGVENVVSIKVVGVGGGGNNVVNPLAPLRTMRLTTLLAAAATMWSTAWCAAEPRASILSP